MTANPNASERDTRTTWTPEGIEIRRDHKGEIDEFCGPHFHFERLNFDHVFFSIGDVRVWLRARKSKITLNYETDDGESPDPTAAPAQQPVPRDATHAMLDAVEGWRVSPAHVIGLSPELAAAIWRAMYDASQEAVGPNGHRSAMDSAAGFYPASEGSIPSGGSNSPAATPTKLSSGPSQEGAVGSAATSISEPAPTDDLVRELRREADTDEREGGFAYGWLRAAAARIESDARALSEARAEVADLRHEYGEHERCIGSLERDAAASRQREQGLRSATERAESCIRLLIARKPCRDVTETLAEIATALAAPEKQTDLARKPE